jgi:hypothetical protein
VRGHVLRAADHFCFASGTRTDHEQVINDTRQAPDGERRGECCFDDPTTACLGRSACALCISYKGARPIPSSLGGAGGLRAPRGEEVPCPDVESIGGRRGRLAFAEGLLSLPGGVMDAGGCCLTKSRTMSGTGRKTTTREAQPSPSPSGERERASSGVVGGKGPPRGGDVRRSKEMGSSVGDDWVSVTRQGDEDLAGRAATLLLGRRGDQHCTEQSSLEGPVTSSLLVWAAFLHFIAIGLLGVGRYRVRRRSGRAGIPAERRSWLTGDPAHANAARAWEGGLAWQGRAPMERSACDTAAHLLHDESSSDERTGGRLRCGSRGNQDISDPVSATTGQAKRVRALSRVLTTASSTWPPLTGRRAVTHRHPSGERRKKTLACRAVWRMGDV